MVQYFHQHLFQREALSFFGHGNIYAFVQPCSDEKIQLMRLERLWCPCSPPKHTSTSYPNPECEPTNTIYKMPLELSHSPAFVRPCFNVGVHLMRFKRPLVDKSLPTALHNTPVLIQVRDGNQRIISLATFKMFTLKLPAFVRPCFDVGVHLMRFKRPLVDKSLPTALHDTPKFFLRVGNVNPLQVPLKVPAGLEFLLALLARVVHLQVNLIHVNLETDGTL